MDFTPTDIKLIHNLFKGREDVFAVRWEKENKSGYMPACSYDPYRYRLHKANGGTFQSYAHKTYLPLSEIELIKHLKGLRSTQFPRCPGRASCRLPFMIKLVIGDAEIPVL